MARLLALCIAAAAPLPANAFDRFTLAVGVAQMDVPVDCAKSATSKSYASATGAKCSLAQAGGAVLKFGVEEWVAATPSGGKVDIAEGLDLVLQMWFDNFVKNSMKGSHTHNATAARLRPSQLPKGLPACKSYTMDQSVAEGSLRERGTFCAVWSDRDQAILVTVGYVQELCLKDACHGPSPEFDRLSKKYLRTFKGR